jgi:hypothetical protein
MPATGPRQLTSRCTDAGISAGIDVCDRRIGCVRAPVVAGAHEDDSAAAIDRTASLRATVLTSPRRGSGLLGCPVATAQR